MTKIRQHQTRLACCGAARGFYGTAMLMAWLVLVTQTTTPTAAQSDPSILSRPWGESSRYAETEDKLFFINGSHARGTSSDLDVFLWDSQGRIKFDSQDQNPRFVLGYHVLTIGTDTPLTAIPTALNDVSIVGAIQLGELVSGWQFSLTGGMGSANDDHWENSDSFYGIGAIEASHKLSQEQSLVIGFSYNGNRTIFPDVPLPYGMYTSRVSPTLTYSIGVPVSMVIWEPIPDQPLILKFTYFVPSNVAIEADYKINEQLGVFAEFSREINGFYLDGTDNTRLFYDITRIVTGVRANLMPLLELRAGVGWAFDQEFSRGFDVRSTTTVAKPTDNILYFVMVEGAF
jgi:hypothetical protein